MARSDVQNLGPVIAVILAGGLARRMGGGDKALLPLGGKPILSHIIGAISPQVSEIALNANGDPTRFDAFGAPVLPDTVAENPGPLAGVLAGMQWAARSRPATRYILTVPGDAPFPPSDLVMRLATPILQGAADMSCASSASRRHPVIGLWPVELHEALKTAVAAEGVRKVDMWTGRYRCAPVDFAPVKFIPLDAASVDGVGETYDPFLNVNRAEDLDLAEQIFTLRGAGAL